MIKIKILLPMNYLSLYLIQNDNFFYFTFNKNISLQTIHSKSFHTDTILCTSYPQKRRQKIQYFNYKFQTIHFFPFLFPIANPRNSHNYHLLLVSKAKQFFNSMKLNQTVYKNRAITM